MDRAVKAFLGLLVVALLVEAAFSLQWRFSLDTPIMLFLASAMDRFGYVPYRDLFDMNMPGMYGAYTLIGRLSGYSNLGVRLVDLSMLAIICTITFLWMRRFNRKVALCGATLFGLAYLGAGAATSLQREYVELLPIAAAVWIASRTEMKGWVRLAAAGFLFGLANTIKPQAGIGLAALVLVELVYGLRQRDRQSSLRVISSILLPAAIGFSIPILAMFAYLVKQQNLGDFMDIAVNYWPLHSSISGYLIVLSGIDHFVYLIGAYRKLGDLWYWVVPSALGVYFVLFRAEPDNQQRRQVHSMVLLAIGYSIYPAVAGQFFPYHYIPFIYFIVQLAALCLVELPGLALKAERWVPVAALALTILFNVNPSRSFLGALGLVPPLTARLDRADAIAAYLKANLGPNDKVQPLDWTGGAVHAMLIANAQLATPFVYDFYFYQSVSNPYIQNLRKRFMQDLKIAKPRFIVDVWSEDKPWVSGADTTRRFDELWDWVNAGYVVAAQGNGYFIYKAR